MPNRSQNRIPQETLPFAGTSPQQVSILHLGHRITSSHILVLRIVLTYAQESASALNAHTCMTRTRLLSARPSFSKTIAPKATTVPFHIFPLLTTPSPAIISGKATAPKAIAISHISMSALLSQFARSSHAWATVRKVMHALIDMPLMSAPITRTKAHARLERLVV